MLGNVVCGVAHQPEAYSALHRQCAQRLQQVSACCMATLPPNFDRSFFRYADLGRRVVNEALPEEQESSLCSLDSVACVGSSALMGHHLMGVADKWRAGSELSAVQLHKVGMNKEERAEVLEQLLALAQRHCL